MSSFESGTIASCTVRARDWSECEMRAKRIRERERGVKNNFNGRSRVVESSLGECP
jgi:hypothetical protein